MTKNTRSLQMRRDRGLPSRIVSSRSRRRDRGIILSGMWMDGITFGPCRLRSKLRKKPYTLRIGGSPRSFSCEDLRTLIRNGAWIKFLSVAQKPESRYLLLSIGKWRYYLAPGNLGVLLINPFPYRLLLLATRYIRNMLFRLYARKELRGMAIYRSCAIPTTTFLRMLPI